MNWRLLKLSLMISPFALVAGCGDSTVDDSAPEAPIVSPDVPSVVIKCEADGCADVVTIFGIKQASVAVHNGDTEVTPLDETTEFSFEVTLAEGMNSFELRAVDNAGNKSKKTRVEILLAVRPDPVTVTAPEVSDVFVYAEQSITWGGTKPAGTGVYMVQQVEGEVVVDALLVAPDAATTWEARANLQTTDDPARNVNNFTFFAVTAQNVRSAPISKEVDYDDVGCQLTIANRTYDGEGNIRQNRPLEYSEKDCTKTVDGEEQAGLCVWTSLVGGAGDDRYSMYPMIGVVCEDAEVKGSIDGSSELQFREAIDEVQWSQDITKECTTCDAADDTAEVTQHVRVWAVLGERETRKRHVWVTTDFTPPTFSDVVYKDEDGNPIAEDATSTAGASIEVCGTTEPHAEVSLENTDTGGVIQAQASGSADADGAFCLTVDLAEGDNNIYLSAIDMARNVSAEEDNPARLFNVDNTGPVVTWITPRANSWVNTGATNVVVEAYDAYNGVDSVRVGIGEGDGVALEPTGEDDGRYTGVIQIPEEGARIELWVVAADGLGTETRSEIAVFRSGEPLIVSNEQDSWNSQVPRIGVGPNGDVYATWETCIGLNACEMELIAAAHLGEDGTWGDPVILNVRNSANGSTPDVAVDENGVGHFVWTDSGRVGGRDGSANVVYTTWDGTAPTISDTSCNNAGATPQPQSPETPGVCWAGFIQSQGGLGDVTSLTSQGISGMDATYPRIAVGSMGPQVVFVVDTQSENTGRAYEVYLATSQEGAWTPQIISDNTAGGEDGADKPDIAMDGSGAAHVVWEDDGDLDGDAENDVDILYVNTGVGNEALLVNGNCGQAGNLDEDGFPIRETSSPVVAVDPEDPNGRAYVAWLAEGGCGAGQNTAVRWAYTEQGAPFTSGTDGEGAFLASAGDEFTTAANRRPEIVVHSVEGDMTTQTVSVIWQTDAPTRGAGGDKDIVLRRYDRSYDGGGEQPAVVVMTESRDGEDNDQQDDYKPSAAVDPGGAIHAVWEKRANREDDKDVFYGVSAP